MFETYDLGLFVLAGVLLNVTPGPDTLYSAGRSTGQGIRAAVVAALGVGADCVIQTTAAAVDFAALLDASAAVFAVVKTLGAAYLVYLGPGMLSSADDRVQRTQHTARPTASLLRVFVQ